MCRKLTASCLVMSLILLAAVTAWGQSVYPFGTTRPRFSHVGIGSAPDATAHIKAAYDAAAYTLVTQADGAGMVFDCTSDGTASFTFNDPIIAAIAGLSGDLTLDDGVGDSPSLIFIDADNNTFTVLKLDAGAATLTNDEGAINLLPSGDSDDYFTFTTAANVPTIGTVGACNLNITAGGGGIGFADENLSTTGSVSGGTLTDGTASITGGALTGLTTPLTAAQGGTGLAALSANVVTLLGAANFAAFKTSLSLNNVENTALSTWAGTSNLTTLGAIASCTSLTSAGTIQGGTLTDGTASLTAGSLTAVKLGTLTSNGFVKTSGGDGTLSVDTATYQASDAELSGIAGLSGTGLVAKTGAGTFSERTVTGTANEVTVTNGDGVSGNPTLSIPAVVDLGGKTSVELPNAADPAVTVAGQFAQDTTDGALIGYDGTAERVYAHPVEQFSFTVYDDTDWASEAVPVWTAPKDMAITITQVHAVSMGTTPSLAYNIEERAKAGMASAGTDIYAADQAADATGEDETSFSNAGIAAGAHLVFTTAAAPETGTVDLIHVVVYYTRDVE